MNRRNYGPGSGVIIDMCRDHGVWFDAEELPAILDWIRRGNQSQAEQHRAEEQARSERLRKSLAPKTVWNADRRSSTSEAPVFDFGVSLLELAYWLWCGL